MAKKRKQSSNDDVKTRLDALIALLLEPMYANKSLDFDQPKAARLLKSIG